MTGEPSKPSIELLLSKEESKLWLLLRKKRKAASNSGNLGDILGRLRSVATLRRSIKIGDTDMIVKGAIRYGAYCERLGLPEDTLLGRRSRESLMKARQSSAERRRSRVSERDFEFIKEAKRMWERNPTLTNEDCAEKVKLSCQSELSIRTIRNVIGPHNPKRL